MLESEIYQESFIGVVVDEVHCVTEWGSSSNNKIVQLFVLFVCVIFVTRNCNSISTPVLLTSESREICASSPSDQLRA